jgi:hypothetical protein
MVILKEILQEINNGKKLFKPQSATDEDFINFQPIAKVLVFANDEGYLDGFQFHKESQTGNRWYDLIMIDGLSHKGESFLVSSNREAEIKLIDAIEFKPNFYGVRVDLKTIWKKFKERKN